MNIFLVILIGILIGTLVNIVADTLPVYRKITLPSCGYCSYRYTFWAYFFYGKCHQCGKPLPNRFWLVSLIFLILSIVFWSKPHQNIGYWATMLVLAYFGVIFIIDVEHRLVLHPTTLAGAVLGLIYGWSQHGIMNSIAGGLIGFTIMAMIYYLGVVYIKIVSRKRGRSTSEVALGFGDVNLALVCGLFLGWPEIVIGLLCAILMGGIVSALMILFMIITKRYRPYFAIPYAPFIILGTIILLFR